MKFVLAVCLVLAVLNAHTRASPPPDGIFEIGNMFQGSVDDDAEGRMSCRSRRGMIECRDIGDDCTKEYLPNGCSPQVGGSCTTYRVGFPMQQVTVNFPCDEPFASRPLVFAYVQGTETSKMFTTTIVDVTASQFKANVQRTDDVNDPVLTCDRIRLCYFALPIA
eukprot:c20298_g1_i1.p1 GENE.c20298_g1_i1~~c20298_g1_i1.p1  ORF type:complete len:180 (-),score=49.03 c20298_g1_i1:51-545(-)